MYVHAYQDSPFIASSIADNEDADEELSDMEEGDNDATAAQQLSKKQQVSDLLLWNNFADCVMCIMVVYLKFWLKW